MASVFNMQNSCIKQKNKYNKDIHEIAKQKYLENITRNYTNRTDLVYPYTRAHMVEIINLMKDGLILKKCNDARHLLPKYNVLNMYEIAEMNKEEVLIRKRKSYNEPLVRVLPAVDCFDIILNIHLRNRHCGVKKLSEEISDKYVLPTSVQQLVLSYCHLCAAKKRNLQNNPQTLNSAEVTIVNMSNSPDNQFHYILFYLDRNTKFMILRPLMADGNHEMALELLKIFLDFGPPAKIETNVKELMKSALQMIGKAHPFNIVLAGIKRFTFDHRVIREKVEKWMTEKNSANWAFGCYMIQWKHNSTAKNNEPTPYECFFSPVKKLVLPEIEEIDEAEMCIGSIEKDDLVLEGDTESNLQNEFDSDEEDIFMYNAPGDIDVIEDEIQIDEHPISIKTENDDVNTSDHGIKESLHVSDVKEEITDISPKPEPNIESKIDEPIAPEASLIHEEISIKSDNANDDDAVLQSESPVLESVNPIDKVLIGQPVTVPPETNMISSDEETPDINVVQNRASTSGLTDKKPHSVYASGKSKVNVPDKSSIKVIPTNKVKDVPDKPIKDKVIPKVVKHIVNINPTAPKTYENLKKYPNASNKVCNICKTEILKAYICIKCNKNVHLFCSDRLIQQGIPSNVLTVTCTSCRLNNNRLEKLKRKLEEKTQENKSKKKKSNQLL